MEPASGTRWRRAEDTGPIWMLSSGSDSAKSEHGRRIPAPRTRHHSLTTPPFGHLGIESAHSWNYFGTLRRARSTFAAPQISDTEANRPDARSA